MRLRSAAVIDCAPMFDAMATHRRCAAESGAFDPAAVFRAFDGLSVFGDRRGICPNVAIKRAAGVPFDQNPAENFLQSPMPSGRAQPASHLWDGTR